MGTVRRHRALRFLALALVVWLAADTLSHGTCSHDRITFARAGRSQVGDSSSRQRSSDREDVNHCSCHWQYLPASSPQPVELRVIAPIVCEARSSVPQIVERSLERPPQRIA
jgi:hypothetical protein